MQQVLTIVKFRWRQYQAQLRLSIMCLKDSKPAEKWTTNAFICSDLIMRKVQLLDVVNDCSVLNPKWETAKC